LSKKSVIAHDNSLMIIHMIIRHALFVIQLSLFYLLYIYMCTYISMQKIV